MSSPGYFFDFNQQAIVPAQPLCDAKLVPITNENQDVAIGLGAQAYIVKDEYSESGQTLQIAWQNKPRPSWFTRDVATQLAKSNKDAIMKLVSNLTFGKTNWFSDAAQSMPAVGCISEDRRRLSFDGFASDLDVISEDIVDTMLDTETIIDTLQLDTEDIHSDIQDSAQDASFGETYQECVKMCIDTFIGDAAEQECIKKNCD